jgi:hypothetical protein
MLTLQQITRAMGGETHGHQALVPGANKVPPYVDCITIAGEADAGRKGAAELAARLHARGLYCKLRFLDDEEARAA